MEDEELLDDHDAHVYRSTPVHNRFVCATPCLVDEPSSGFKTPHLPCTGEGPSVPSALTFTPIAEDEVFRTAAFPGVNQTLHYPQHTASTDATLHGRKTPVLLSSLQEEITEPDEDTILNRPATLEKPHDASEDGRQSPFGPAPVVTLDSVYTYHASRLEMNEMEQLKWQVQQQWFQRCADLKQREPYWGTLQLREGRVFFHPGTQRETILNEQRFVEQSLGRGDPVYNMRRRSALAEELARFTQEEKKHKQALMHVQLEKESAFYNLPILGNRFLLTRLLGKGGNAEVWEVMDFANHKRECALKLSISHKHARREHYTHKQLNHPHIVTVDETVYTMEYRDQLYTAFAIDRGETDLQQLIELHGHFNESTAFRVLAQLLDAVNYLHNNMHIAHYDIKPTNILVGWGNCIKLTDFDLARRVHDPITSSVVGTLRYLPPECFRPHFGACQATAEKADIWMIGIVYCMVLCGHHPIIAEKSTAEVARATLGQYQGRMDYLVPPGDVSPVSRWIIQGCLDPDPRCRPTALELVQKVQQTMGP